jgi:TRAP-type C4-dicarboxylate transport system permease small subunit
MVATLQRARRHAGTAMARAAGAAGLVLLSLLGLNVGSRLFDLNLAWIAETARIVFMWGMGFGMIAVSLFGLHFRVDLANLSAEQNAEPTDLWEIAVQMLACAVLAYVLYFAIPSIARAATQVFASVPLSYGTMRLALVVGIGGMLVAHLWRVLEIVLTHVRPAPANAPE